MTVEFEPGARVEFLGFGVPDPYSRLKPGDRGTVRFVDSLGTVHVDWEFGGALGLIAGVDRFRVVDEEEDRHA